MYSTIIQWIDDAKRLSLYRKLNIIEFKYKIYENLLL